MPRLKRLLTIRVVLPTSFTEDQLSSLDGRLREELAREGGVNQIVVAYGRKPIGSSGE
jgi:hypothetical protein